MKNANKVLITLALIFTVIFAGCSSDKGASLTKTNSEDSSVQILKEDAAKSETQLQEEKLTQIIADGTYSEDISYSSPGGTDTFKLNMVVKDDKIESLSLDVVKAHEVSANFISNTNKELQTLVVGKSLSEIKIPTIVSGASLTTKAFNDKLTQLKTN